MTAPNNRVEIFLSWIEEKYSNFSYRVERSSGGGANDNHSAFFEMESEIGVGRITLWEDGSYIKEYLFVDPDKEPVVGSGDSIEFDEFNIVFGDMARLLSIDPR